MLKVTALGQFLLTAPSSPLATGTQPLLKRLGAGLASGSLGCMALRAAARRCGVEDKVLKKPAFWAQAALEATRIGAFLHDFAYPAVMARKVAGAVAPLRPNLPAEASMLETSELVARQLVAAPFNRGSLVGSRGLQPDDEEAFRLVLAESHSLQAGCAMNGGCC